METYQLKNEQKIYYVTAKSFPEGIGEAFQTLEKSLPDFYNRTFFGISYPDEKGSILYQAGASAMAEEEGAPVGCETFILQKGAYLTETIEKWKGKEAKIGEVFRKLGDARPDTVAPGIEWYKGCLLYTSRCV